MESCGMLQIVKAGWFSNVWFLQLTSKCQIHLSAMAPVTLNSLAPAASGRAFLNSTWSCSTVPLRLNLGAQQRRRHPCLRSCYPFIVSPVSSREYARCDERNEPSFSLNRRRAVVASVLLPLLPLVTELGFSSISSAAEEEAVRLEKIREAIRKSVTKAKAAGVLRLVFHDAGTFNIATNKGGMNGSVVLELDRPENQGLNRSVKVLMKVKAALEPDVQVSWADLIAVAGAEAVSICGGPRIDVKLGRLDALVPDPEGQMPEESLTGSQLRKAFEDKGFSTQELVALSGAHSVGGKGFGDPYIFDNIYYKILLQKPWLGDSSFGRSSHYRMWRLCKEDKSSMIGLDSDRALPEDEECLKWVNTYAEHQDLFFQDFADAYIKLVNTGVDRVA